MIRFMEEYLESSILIIRIKYVDLLKMSSSIDLFQVLKIIFNNVGLALITETFTDDIL